MALTYALTPMSLPEVAKLFLGSRGRDNPDHTTVLHAVGRITEAMRNTGQCRNFDPVHLDCRMRALATFAGGRFLQQLAMCVARDNRTTGVLSPKRPASSVPRVDRDEPNSIE
jgi:hypothetical protein